MKFYKVLISGLQKDEKLEYYMVQKEHRGGQLCKNEQDWF